MKKIVLAHLLLLFSIPGFCQSTSGSMKLFKCIVVHQSGFTETGVLYALNDSSIQLVNISQTRQAKRSVWLVLPQELDINSINAEEIQLLKFRKIGAIGTGVVAGGAIGMIIGGVIGGALHPPCDPQPKFFGLSDCDMEIYGPSFSIIGGASLGAFIGGSLGLLIGSSNKKFIIEGNLNLYHQKKPEMERYLYPTRKQL
jgi:hypothetical protein